MFHKPASKIASGAEPHRPPAAPFKVADIVRGRDDASGVTVETIYVKRAPRYAVYRTMERVVVQYADHDALAAAQAASLAKLSPVRGVINGLIDGWRTSRMASRRARALSFDRQVADALTVALEGDQVCAEELLADIKGNLKEIRVSWARFLYLLYASAAALLFCVVAGFGYGMGWAPEKAEGLWLAGAAGAVGAFFSIAVGIRNRTVLPDLRWVNNAADAVLRVVIGVIGAVMLTLLLRAGVVTSDLLAGGGKLSTEQLELAIVIAFTAGFLERLVPDLLEKTTFTATKPGADSAAKAAAAAAAPGRTVAPPLALAAAEAQALIDDDEDACACAGDHAPDDATPDHDLPVAVGGVAAIKIPA